MSGPVFVGLDIHRKTIVATALSSEGDTLREATLGPSPDELTDFLQSLPGVKRVVMEPCTIWEPLYSRLESEGMTVTLTNPLRTRLIADATIKTDKVDSQALATLLRLGAIPQIYVPPREGRHLRHLVRERQFYQRKIGALMNHAYARLIREGIEYPDRALKTVKGRQRIRTLDNPEVNRALDGIEYFRQVVRALDREVHQAYLASPDAQWLKTIPGIGEFAAVSLAAFICPIERFASAEKLASYAGLAPSTHQSGEFCYQGKLKWDSNEFLQWLFIELSWTHRQRAPRGDVARAGTRVSRRRGKGKGTVAAAHKLLRIVYAILKEKRAYRAHAPERPAAMQDVRSPSRVAATQCVRGIALGPNAADRLLAH